MMEFKAVINGETIEWSEIKRWKAYRRVCSRRPPAPALRHYYIRS